MSVFGPTYYAAGIVYLHSWLVMLEAMPLGDSIRTLVVNRVSVCAFLVDSPGLVCINIHWRDRSISEDVVLCSLFLLS